MSLHLGKLGRAWDMGKRLQAASGELDITPWAAILTEIRRSAYRAAWIDQRVDDEISKERQLEHEAEAADRYAQAAEVRRWLTESRRERNHLARVSKAAVDAGLAERYVQSVEVEARLVAGVIERSLGVLDLTDDQKRAVAVELRDALKDVSVELHRRHSAVAALPIRDEETR